MVNRKKRPRLKSDNSGCLEHVKIDCYAREYGYKCAVFCSGFESPQLKCFYCFFIQS